MEELLRTVRLCQPDWEARRRITFTASAVEKPAWLAWRDSVFAPMLPVIERARDAAARGALKDLVDCDLALDSLLLTSAAAASREAGHTLAANHGSPTGERLWVRYCERVAEGKTPGHLAVALAVRAAAFHIAPANFLGAYLFLEACGGWKSYDAEKCVALIEDCLTVRPVAETPFLRAA